MGYSTKIPKHARVTHIASGIIKEGPYKGQFLIVTCYEGYASKGYASDYKQVPHAWLQYEWPGMPEKNRAYQYSGKNITKATDKKVWQELRAILGNPEESIGERM